MQKQQERRACLASLLVAAGLVALATLSQQQLLSAPIQSELDALPDSALPPIPAEAKRRMEHSLGHWEVRAEHFDAEGKVVRTSGWENSAEYLLEGRLVLLTHNAPKLGSISKTLVFYSDSEEKWYLVDVNQKGDLWILSGDLDREVITSEPKKREDGRTVIIRFTHENIKDDSFEALMEYSYDGGASWTKGSRQYLTRTKKLTSQ